MDDLISRQAAIDALHMHLMYRMGTDSNKKRLDEWINNLPSAQPYTEAEIQKMQDLEQAELDKAFELGKQAAQSEPHGICMDCLMKNVCRFKIGLGDYGYCSQWRFDGIRNFPSAQQEPQWIPCSERLPSEGENVLLCNTLFGNVAIGKLIRYNTSCCWEVDHWDCDIEDWQAWMPLPEPWRGEQ